MIQSTIEANQALNDVQRLIRPCIQCGTCTGSCPNALEMDLTPRKMWRLVLFDRFEEVMASRTFILCSDCYSCTLRCPRGLPLTESMEALKGIAFARRQPHHRNSRLFYEAFMQTVRRHGRIHEMAFMTRYFSAVKSPSATLRFTPLGLKLMGKGKVAMGGKATLGSLDALFAKVAAMDASTAAGTEKEARP